LIYTKASKEEEEEEKFRSRYFARRHGERERERDRGGTDLQKEKRRSGGWMGKKEKKRPLWSRCAICLLTPRDWARHGSHEYNQEDFVSSYYYYSFFEFPKMKNGGTTENSFRSR
jgi:hypothetical protein